MASKRYLFVVLVVLSNVLAAPSAQGAGPTAQEKETARAMMDEGHARREAGDHAAALAQFQGADAIMHVPTTGLEAAREQVSLGQLVEACDTLTRVIRAPASAQEPEAFRAARKSAEAIYDALSERIAALRIAVEGISVGTPMQVSVDGLPIPSEALVAPFKVNPGHHVVSAASAAATASAEVDVAEAQTVAVTVTLPFSPSSQEDPAQQSHATLSDASGGVARDESSAPSIVPWLRWGGFGLAIAGVGAGSIAGAMSMSTASSVAKGCVNKRCPLSSQSDIDSARTLAMVSNVSFVAAGVGVVAGVASFLVGKSPALSSRATTAGAHMTVWVGAGSAGVSGAF